MNTTIIVNPRIVSMIPPIPSRNQAMTTPTRVARANREIIMPSRVSVLDVMLPIPINRKNNMNKVLMPLAVLCITHAVESVFLPIFVIITLPEKIDNKVTTNAV